MGLVPLSLLYPYCFGQKISYGPFWGLYFPGGLPDLPQNKTLSCLSLEVLSPFLLLSTIILQILHIQCGSPFSLNFFDPSSWHTYSISQDSCQDFISCMLGGCPTFDTPFLAQLYFLLLDSASLGCSPTHTHQSPAGILLRSQNCPSLGMPWPHEEMWEPVVKGLLFYCKARSSAASSEKWALTVHQQGGWGISDFQGH